ncbi:MAG: hypothetical protein K8R48_01265 [Alphaproteobacteria bacterium]|nr:hypothetical protein [Alphaproteobacteria bacterium]
MPKLNINYEKDGNKFLVSLTAHEDPLSFWALASFSADPNENAFTRIKGHPALRDKTGEELVKAILTHAGSVFRVERFKNGQPSDGPNGEPALIEFGKDRLTVNLYKDGKLNDGPNGEPAVQELAPVQKGNQAAGWRPTEGTKSYKDGVEMPLKDGEIKFSVKTAGPALRTSKTASPKV